MTNTETKTRLIETKITRRKMLKTLATGSAAVAVTTSGALALNSHSTSDDIGQRIGRLDELIADFNAIEVELITKMEETDAHLGPGKNAPDHIWSAQFAVGDRLDAAALSICSYHPANAAENVAKAEWLLNKWWRDTQPEWHEVQALLYSMVEMVA